MRQARAPFDLWFLLCEAVYWDIIEKMFGQIQALDFAFSQNKPAVQDTVPPHLSKAENMENASLVVHFPSVTIQIARRRLRPRSNHMQYTSIDEIWNACWYISICIKSLVLFTAKNFMKGFYNHFIYLASRKQAVYPPSILYLLNVITSLLSPICVLKLRDVHH